MPRHWFHPPVRVQAERAGLIDNVSSVELAAEYLLQWSHPGPMSRKAREACIMALAGEIDPGEVRPLFEAAAREAGELVRG